MGPVSCLCVAVNSVIHVFTDPHLATLSWSFDLAGMRAVGGWEADRGRTEGDAAYAIAETRTTPGAAELEPLAISIRHTIDLTAWLILTDTLSWASWIACTVVTLQSLLNVTNISAIARFTHLLGAYLAALAAILDNGNPFRTVGHQTSAVTWACAVLAVNLCN